MKINQRNKIIQLARVIYKSQGCVFPEDDREMVEYLWESEHPAERGCLQIAIEAHNIYYNDNMDENSFYEWHDL